MKLDRECFIVYSTMTLQVHTTVLFGAKERLIDFRLGLARWLVQSRIS